MSLDAYVAHLIYVSSQTALIASFLLTPSCYSQQGNTITNLEGVGFSAGLAELWLVSFIIDVSGLLGFAVMCNGLRDMNT